MIAAVVKTKAGVRTAANLISKFYSALWVLKTNASETGF
jgi:hypothetical protein